EETGYIPKEKYSFGPEIFAHAQRIGKHFNLYQRACFQTQIKEARWDNDEGRWTITTHRGDVFRARFVIMSSGPLNRPKLPGIPIEEDLVGDKWTSLFKNLARLLSGKNNSDLSDEEMALMSEIADFQKMNEIRERVSSTVSDSRTAEALKPWYGQWCKRPTFN